MEGESFVKESTPDGLQHWITPAGNFWSPRGNALFFDLAEQSADLYESPGAGVRHGDVVLDCGANVGTFTRTALLAGASKVIAFDIDPRNLECLRRNFAPEIQAGRVAVVEKGVWNAEASMKAKFYTNTNLNTITMANRVETAEQPLVKDVPLTAIDTVVKELGLARVDFIKMDVEGAELKALEGAAGTIRTYRPRLSIATENEPEDVHAIPQWVNRLGLNYQTRLGSCRRIRPWMIRPEVAVFVPVGR
jgi:FkbM family methyltransferase